MEEKLYHGCMNTFAIIKTEEERDYTSLAISLCKKHQTDGFIAVKTNPLEMIFYNADGSRGTMCGNGIRCLARYCFDEAIIKDKKYQVLTLAGILDVEIASFDPFLVKVKMGKAIFDPKASSVNTNKKDFLDQELVIKKRKVVLSTIFMNTVHTVVFVDDFSEIDFFGEAICNHEIYLEKTNVNFVKIIDSKTIEVRTYERGVGWTLACGTGASSAFVLGRLKKKLDDKVLVKFLGGEIYLSADKEDNVFMEGPAEEIKK
ncbi:MAG: diaminopimelate epimerase [Bacilli bacterium]|jgi:diaminopimelate epimerase